MPTTSSKVTIEVPGDHRIKLLSFIYRLYTDKDFQKKFQAGTEAAMDEYGLSADQKVAVHHSGLDPTYVNAAGVPRNADWWKNYALFNKKKLTASVRGASDPTTAAELKALTEYDDTGPNRARMASVVYLLVEELCGKETFDEAW